MFPPCVHIAVFHCFFTAVRFLYGVSFCSFSYCSFFFLLSPLPSPPPSPLTSILTSLLVLSGAVLVLLLFLPRTDVQEIPAQLEKGNERQGVREGKERGSTWRQIRWTVESAVAVWKCGIPFRDLLLLTACVLSQKMNYCYFPNSHQSQCKPIDISQSHLKNTLNSNYSFFFPAMVDWGIFEFHIGQHSLSLV